MVKTQITYSAIFQYDVDGINIRFPDLGVLSCADTTEEAQFMAKDALELWLHGMMIDDLPQKTLSKSIILQENEKLFEITVEMEVMHNKLFSAGVQEL